MNFGITAICLAPLRVEPTHQSEMVSQLLFGEIVNILSSKNDWLKVSTTDYTEAWVEKSQLKEISKKEFLNLQAQELSYSFDAFNTGITQQEHIPIVLGSNLPHFDGLSFKLNKEKIVFNGQVIKPTKDMIDYGMIEKICYKYLNAPFLWGGRSPFGIDASGLVQMIYKLLGKQLPRSIQQQKESLHTSILFLPEAQEGDIIFFEDANQNDHVGVYLGGNNIIHAWGKVRIDTLDTHGIYNIDLKSYSHNLKSIRRV